VDERVGVDQLDRGGEREEVVQFVPQGLGGGEREHRPDALAARQKGVAHRLVEPGRRGLAREAQAVQVCVDAVLQVDRVGGLRGTYAQSNLSSPGASADAAAWRSR